MRVRNSKAGTSAASCAVSAFVVVIPSRTSPAPAVACAMTFRLWPATLCDPKPLFFAANASDIKYADLDQSTGEL
jgi:hypothetical protein